MAKQIPIGARAEAEETVEFEHTLTSHHPELPPVYSTPDMIRQLPTGFALVIRGGNAPVIARLPRAWRNPAYRRARRQHPAPAGPARASARFIPDPVPAGLIPGEGLRLYPVGRLDADSSGLILLTNDGELANRLTHPSFEVQVQVGLGQGRQVAHGGTIAALTRSGGRTRRRRRSGRGR